MINEIERARQKRDAIQEERRANCIMMVLGEPEQPGMATKVIVFFPRRFFVTLIKVVIKAWIKKTPVRIEWEIANMIRFDQ